LNNAKPSTKPEIAKTDINKEKAEKLKAAFAKSKAEAATKKENGQKPKEAAKPTEQTKPVEATNKPKQPKVNEGTKKTVETVGQKNDREKKEALEKHITAQRKGHIKIYTEKLEKISEDKVLSTQFKKETGIDLKLLFHEDQAQRQSLAQQGAQVNHRYPVAILNAAEKVALCEKLGITNLNDYEHLDLLTPNENTGNHNHSWQQAVKTIRQLNYLEGKSPSLTVEQIFKIKEDIERGRPYIHRPKI
jgi:hypothetical protein